MPVGVQTGRKQTPSFGPSPPLTGLACVSRIMAPPEVLSEEAQALGRGLPGSLGCGVSPPRSALGKTPCQRVSAGVASWSSHSRERSVRVPAALGVRDEQDRYSPSLQEWAARAQGRHTADGCPKSGGDSNGRSHRGRGRRALAGGMWQLTGEVGVMTQGEGEPPDHWGQASRPRDRAASRKTPTGAEAVGAGGLQPRRLGDAPRCRSRSWCGRDGKREGEGAGAHR